MDNTTCCVVGGGPAGMVLGLLLARAGVQVTVLEKHGDFLRDFRGDTVHASTLTLLDELGLGDRFAAVPHRMLDGLTLQLDGGAAHISLRALPGPHKHIALVPQWDFLDLLADVAADEPTFRLIMHAEAVGLLRDGNRVTGVRYRDQDGTVHELATSLVVAADGRGSVVRESAGLRPRSFGAPIDVQWFRLPRHADDLVGGFARVSGGRIFVLIDRGEYWQCGHVIAKGTDTEMRAAGLDAFRADIARLVPWLADRVDALQSWDEVKLLDVRLDRLRRWSGDGVLAIGDAAHAMSPVGGVGINLAVQDGVAAARLLAGPLLRAQQGGERPRPSELRRVERRRWLPTALVQGFQRFAHRNVLRAALRARAGETPRPRPKHLPAPLRLINRFPRLQAVPTAFIAIGPLPEHAPSWATPRTGRGAGRAEADGSARIRVQPRGSRGVGGGDGRWAG